MSRRSSLPDALDGVVDGSFGLEVVLKAPIWTTNRATGWDFGPLLQVPSWLDLASLAKCGPNLGNIWAALANVWQKLANFDRRWSTVPHSADQVWSALADLAPLEEAERWLL